MSKVRKKAPRARPGKGAAERLSISVSAETAAWLRAEAERDGCSLGDVIEGARLAILAADAGHDHDLRLARRGLRAAGEPPSVEAELERLGQVTEAWRNVFGKQPR